MSNVLHDRYRPVNFKAVVGQGHIIPNLQKAIKDRSTHAFLFCGPAGCGKTTLARICASKLGCEPGDIREIDGATTTGVDDMRELQLSMRYKPLSGGKYRGVIIDEAHRVSKQALDSLLKILEEPPEHLYWFLCTTAPEKLPVTVRSRCMVAAVKPMNGRDMIEYVSDIAYKEQLSIPEDVLAVVANESGGSFRQALVNLATCSGSKTRKEALASLQKVGEEDASLELCRFLVKGGSWMKVMAILEKLEKEPPEGIRILVANYMASCILKAKSEDEVVKFLSILEHFSTPYNDSERMAPLLLSIGRVLYAGE